MPHKVTHATPYAVHIDMVAYRSAKWWGIILAGFYCKRLCSTQSIESFTQSSFFLLSEGYYWKLNEYS